MKKLTTLLFALLFTAGIAFGQNSATTNQNGSNHDAKIIQKNSGNDATIDQSGRDNYAHLKQVFEAGTGFGKNVADVTQTGHNNNVRDINDYDGARQVGAGNSFKVLQVNHGQDVEEVRQGTHNQASYNGVIDIEQGTASIQQANDGETPEATAYKAYNHVYHAIQTGNGNDLHVYQNDENEVWVQKQVSTANDAANGNSIDIDQLGAESSVGFRNGTYDGHGAYQEGTNNSMDIEQGTHDRAGNKTVNSVFAGVDAGGHGDQSLVQLGGNNSLTIDQEDGSSFRPYGHVNAVKAVLQNGFNNDATITQGAFSNSRAAVSQVGDNNSSTITQN